MRAALAIVGGLATLALVWAAATGRGASPPAGRAGCPSQASRILVIGDSHGNGLAGTAFGASAPLVKLAQGCGTPMAVMVKGGMGAPYFAPLARGLVAQSRPTVLLVVLGLNDFPNTNAPLLEASIGQIAAAARSAGARLVWVSPAPSPKPYDVDKSDVMGMWRKQGALEFPLAEQGELPRQADQIHYTTAGYAEMAARLWAVLSEL